MDVAACKNEVAMLQCETASVEFKSAFDTNDRRLWPQLIRSVIAMHNSGGGVIVFGLGSDGEPAGTDVCAVLKCDPIQISEKVKHYTDRPLPNVLVESFSKGSANYPGWIIPSASVPLPFSRHGDVHNGKEKPEKLFHPGQVYVRRGPSSVPADAEDFAQIVSRIRSLERQEFAAQIGKFAVVPPGHTIQVLAPGAVVSSSAPAGAVRITDDPSAPAAIVVDKFKTHPHRQRELVQRLATRIPGCRANGHDITCIRKLYASEIEAKGFIYNPPHSSPHYSDDFAEWIVGRIGSDPAFLDKTRAALKQGNAA